MLMQRLDANFGFIRVRRDASGFGSQNLGQFALQEAFQVNVKEQIGSGEMGPSHISG
jgi:hypothetical protein